MKYLPLAIIMLYSLTAFSQSDLAGIWDTGEENTLIEIAEINEKFIGKLKSSDNENAQIGRVILKDLEQNGTKWTGQIWAAKRQRWFDVEITPGKNLMELEIDGGILTKTVEWKKQL